MKLVNVTAIKTFICGAAVGISIYSIIEAYLDAKIAKLDDEIARQIKETLQTKDKDRN